MRAMAEHMRALAAVTGWAALSAPADAGVWRVALENDLDAAFFSLGEKLCVMHGVVAELPPSAFEADALCSEAARRQMAVLRERPSILALEEAGPSPVPGEAALAAARLVCFRTVPLQVDTEALAAAVQAWLNDFAWWKSTLAGAGAQEAGLRSVFGADVFSGLKL